MVVAHQGVEIKEVPGIGMGQKRPPTPQTAAAIAAGAPRIIDTKPGPPPILTKRGADILVRVEKMLDEAGKTAGKTSSSDPAKPAKPVSSNSVAFPDSFAAAAAGQRGCDTRAAQELTVRLIFITLVALMLATVVGLGATWMTATRGTDLGTLTIGAWTARPKTGTADVDPYSRAVDRPQRRIADRHRRRRRVLGDHRRHASSRSTGAATWWSAA